MTHTEVPEATEVDPPKAPKNLPGGKTPDQLRAEVEKVGEVIHPDGHGEDILRDFPQSDGDEAVMVEVAVLLRQVIALSGGTGRAPSRRAALIRTKAEEALLYALSGHLTGVD